MNKLNAKILGAAVLATSFVGAAHAGLTISALASPFSAAGNYAPPSADNGSAPVSMSLAAGSGRTMTFDVSGSWNCCGTTSFLYTGADGRAGEETHVGNVNKISGPDAGRVMFLAGVFLGADSNGNPILPGSAPSRSQYMAAGDFQSASYSGIGLGQIFFIGDGYTGTEVYNAVDPAHQPGTATTAASKTGTQQIFYVPDAAAFLYLGVVDGCSFGGPPSCYNDNRGSMEVAVNQIQGTVSKVPEPGTTALLALALAGLALSSRRRQA